MSMKTLARATLVIALLLLIPILSACGGGSSSSSSQSTSTTAKATASPSGTPAINPGGPMITSTPSAASPEVIATPATSGSPAASTTPSASGTLPSVGHETELTFKSGPDTLYGSLLMPDMPSGTKVPAALIISGSGPTDRNGNDAQLQQMNTNLNFARALAADGIASFRYDKLGSGKTGLATHANGQGITFNLFVQEALDAYATMAKQPGVDPSRLMILGHSEGGLFAVVLTKDLQGKPDAPKSLILAAPLGRRFLDVIRRQVTNQVQQAEAARQMNATQGKALLAQLNDAITGLRTKGALPSSVTDSSLIQLFSPVNIPFIVAEDKID
ncbi:MAG TPA: alpha/beta hydrolase, partial [Thermomicrobiaceae bacterium]|nr:alpha/beta hydrolase [Thermomicrobiaceae bacterium]